MIIYCPASFHGLFTSTPPPRFHALSSLFHLIMLQRILRPHNPSSNHTTQPTCLHPLPTISSWKTTLPFRLTPYPPILRPPHSPPTKRNPSSLEPFKPSHNHHLPSPSVSPRTRPSPSIPEHLPSCAPSSSDPPTKHEAMRRTTSFRSLSFLCCQSAVLKCRDCAIAYEARVCFHTLRAKS